MGYQALSVLQLETLASTSTRTDSSSRRRPCCSFTPLPET